MKSLEHRDKVVSKVQAACAKYPTFDSLPYTTDPFVMSIYLKEPMGQSEYVKALYQFFDFDPDMTLIGRKKTCIVGKDAEVV